MPNISTESKSFIILFFIALFGTVFCFNLSIDLLNKPVGTGNLYEEAQTILFPNGTVKNPVSTEVDTSDWKTYVDTDYNFSFLYRPDWKVLPITKKGGYDILQIDPGKKYYNIKIYISPKDYYIMEGLPTRPDTIGGKQASNVVDLLYGVKPNENYFTFDIGLSTSLKPYFNALVHSVKFGN